MENPTKAKEPDYGKRIETHPRGVSPPNDRQGHVNNAVFSTFLETGRCEVLYGGDRPLHDNGASFVIASLKVDFLAEITWPGEVAIGTRVSRIGNSSLGLEQGLFQRGACVAFAETVIVQTNDESRKAQPLSDRAKQALAKYVTAT